MTPYVALIILTILVRFSLSANGETYAIKQENEKRTIGFFFWGYLLLLCLRADSVGRDLKVYIPNWFYAFQTIEWKTLFELYNEEWLFVGLTKLVGTFTSSKQIYLSIVAMLTIFPIMTLYKKEAEDGLLCCAVFLITLLFEMFFSGLRQGIAIAMAAPAYLYAKNKRILPFSVMVLIAFGFHTTGLVIALIYPVYHLRITRKWLIFLVPLLAFVYIYNDVIFVKLINTFGTHFLDRGYKKVYESTGQTGLMLLYIIFFIYCFAAPDENAIDKEYIGLRNLLVLATILQLFAPVHVVASRVNYYFNLFIPITLTKVDRFSNVNKKVTQLATLIMIAVFILKFVFLKEDSLDVFDYRFFFEA